jgi:hypothetical protein
MIDKELKAIYEYMGWCLHNTEDGIKYTEYGYLCPLCNTIIVNRKLDSNSAWECVQEMERRSHYQDFEWFWLDEMKKLQVVGSSWIMNPTNFFQCFAKFLEEKEEK